MPGGTVRPLGCWACAVRVERIEGPFLAVSDCALAVRLRISGTMRGPLDPPGFALECFDPVGTFRTRYRISKGVKRTADDGLRFLHKDYDSGRRVDCGGQMDDGFTFTGIRDFKQHLMKSKEQVARNLVSLLITFATGAEIQFADRQEVEAILHRHEVEDYPLRRLIYEVVSSRMFQHR